MNPTIKNHSESIKGYKAVKRDSKGYYTDGMGNAEKVYFKKGQTVEVKGAPVLCENGIHFFRNIALAIDYLENGNAIIEVESIGDIQEDTEKAVTNKIKIGSKVTLRQLKSIFDNPENMNSGGMNSGDMNSGGRNSGGRNSGYRNSGYRNSGDMNSGDRNSGDRNSGGMNSGDMNSGDMNSGDGYRNYFCTKTKYFLFDIEVKEKTIEKVNNIDMYWFELEEQGTDGYKKAWSECPKEVLDEFRSIPQFKKNKAKFKEITGLDL